MLSVHAAPNSAGVATLARDPNVIALVEAGLEDGKDFRDLGFLLREEYPTLSVGHVVGALQRVLSDLELRRKNAAAARVLAAFRSKGVAR